MSELDDFAKILCNSFTTIIDDEYLLNNNYIVPNNNGYITSRLYYIVKKPFTLNNIDLVTNSTIAIRMDGKLFHEWRTIQKSPK